MVEEQIFSRLHRMGQNRDVTTIRYVMRDSVEEVMNRIFPSTIYLFEP